VGSLRLELPRPAQPWSGVLAGDDGLVQFAQAIAFGGIGCIRRFHVPDRPDD
jgi:hypothetical protein